MDLLTPLEINKKIAELKGYKIIFEHDNSLRISWLSMDQRLELKSPQSVEEEMINNGLEIMGPMINWAENINDAWELFEENHEVSIKKMHYTNNTICYQCAFRDSNLNVIGDSSANTAPMAICLAWIKWKENHK